MFASCLKCHALCWVGLLSLLTAAECQAQLAAPFAVHVNNQPLDVELEGGAAPALFDWDRDGVPDLLVGEEYNGRLRIYRNLGTITDPLFSHFVLFQQGRPEGRVPTNFGFRPHIVDLDHDGLPDILSPAWHGKVQWFRQTQPGIFAAGQFATNAEGKTINMAWSFGVTTCDWDEDGKLDILVGVDEQLGSGKLVLLKNIGEAGTPRFEGPTTVLKLPQVSALAPVATDWDNDGNFDLLIGTRTGSVLLLTGQGPPGKPTFAEPVELISAPRPGEDRGELAYVSIADWNGDGRPDILLGDSGQRFEKKLSPAEEQTKRKTGQQLEHAFVRWSRVYRSYRLLKAGQAGTGQAPLPQQPGTEEPAALTAARKQLQRLTTEQELLYLAQDALQAGQQIHGRVWVFLRE